MALTVTDSTENFSSWLSKDFVPNDLKVSLSKVSILIVPFENLRDTPKPIFPVGTEEIIRYFKEKLPSENAIDICIADEDYQEFAFYSDYKRLGNFVVNKVALPVFITVLSSFVYDRYIKQDETKPQVQIIDKSTNVKVNNHISTLADKKYLEPTHIKFSVTVVDTVGSSKCIKFEGPASEMDTVLKSLKEYER